MVAAAYRVINARAENARPAMPATKASRCPFVHISPVSTAVAFQASVAE